MTSNQHPTAVFSGSFDPFTMGHLDIVQRASKLFTQVVIVIAHNPDKQGWLPVAVRKQLILESVQHLPNVQVDSWDGLLVHYIQKMGKPGVLVRGLRGAGDLDYELSMSVTNKQLCPQCETIFLATESQYRHISSSLVRQLVGYGAGVENFVPPCINDYILNHA
jgi:pantetheine-phosphate adenylyltransferase